MMSDDNLRALIRLIPPARSLKQDLEKSLHLETWPSTGDMAVRMFQGLHRSAAALTDDVYVQSLELATSEGASDKEKVAMATLAAGQLLAYLEGETGLAGYGGGGDISIQTAPKINIAGPVSTTSRLMDRMLGGKGDTGDEDEKEEVGD